MSDTSRSASSICTICYKKACWGEWALSMVGVEEGREFRFRGDLYSQESTFPLVIIFYDWLFSHMCTLYFPFNSWLSFQRLCRLLWGYPYSGGFRFHCRYRTAPVVCCWTCWWSAWPSANINSNVFLQQSINNFLAEGRCILTFLSLPNAKNTASMLRT